jgi:hypothetical protein
MPVNRGRRSIPLGVALGLALLASACASGDGATTDAGVSPGEGAVTSSPAPSSGGTGSGPPPAPAAVPEILDFEAPLVDGGTLEGAELAGAPVAVWFWAPW